ncbi:MAG: type II toxin-antitoxin system RelE/ParE family toxin [Rhodospirillales bacterium]|jgi:toxin ParE1/3/4|nr:type II toxin-antitoxin system RelE/ParE family toxin [Alphaproteobacteria bacterium]MDP6927575.1 type II toxin-antitoxin system RelE/ParE family toxin [Rhodospirillales bacterium]
MSDYRLSAAAKQDLIDIARYGDEQHGVAQSNRYRDQLKQRFSQLAEQPLLYAAVDHIRPGYRRSVCGSHSIYYRIIGDTVEIMRIIGRQDPDGL